MVEMKVREYHIGNVARVNTLGMKAAHQIGVAMGFVEAKKLGCLLIAQSRINQNEPRTMGNQHASHGPCAQIIGIGGYMSAPKRFGHHAKHGPAIEFKQSCINTK